MKQGCKRRTLVSNSDDDDDDDHPQIASVEPAQFHRERASERAGGNERLT